jgi:exonuclease VII small subunit
MRQQNENLEREEAKSDKIRISIAENQFQAILKEAELQRLDSVIRELEEQQSAQEESINSLEEAIEEERRKGNKQAPQKLPRALVPIIKQVGDQRKVNHQIQTANAALAKEISDIERDIRSQKEATNAFAQVLSERVDRYKSEYRALSKALIEGQGEDMSLLIQRDRLKDLYFNALVIQLKLQFQIMGQASLVDVASLYQNVEMVDYSSWPKLVESALLDASKAKPEGKRKTNPTGAQSNQ